MSDCVFCSIVEGKIPAEMYLQNDTVTVFRDANPVAPVHMLVIPSKHVATLEEADAALLGELLDTACTAGEETDEHGYGFRIAVNSGKIADVDHLHVHVVGGSATLGHVARGGE